MQLPQLMLSQDQQLGVQGVQLLVACDPDYFKNYAITLAYSLEQNSPNHSLHLHIFGQDDSVIKQIQKLKQNLQKTHITWSYEGVSFSDKNSKAVYCSCVRFIRLTQLITHFNIPILSLDADSLIVHPLDSLTKDSETFDIVIRKRFEMEQIQFKFLTSTVFFKPSQATFSFLNYFSQLIANAIVTGKAYWYLDQVSFYEAYQNVSGVSIGDISAKYADWEFDDNSCIWAGKGNRKHGDEKYLAKVQEVNQQRINSTYVNKFDITHIFRADPTNVGDWYCPPFRYLPLFSSHNIVDIFRIQNNSPLSYILLIGGGGLISPSFPQLKTLVQIKNKVTIGWGIGHNMLVDKKPLGYIPPCDLKFPDYVNDFDLLGVRDFTDKHTWVPCASCFHENLNRVYKSKHEIVIYEHKKETMGRSRYKIHENQAPHFLTCTIINWLPLFTRQETVQIIKN